jgi:DNA-directed RNA polymerase specialized sigma24 family protein
MTERRKRLRAAGPSESTRRDVDTSTSADEACSAQLVLRLIEGMSRQERLVVALRYVDELTVPEIAAVLRLPIDEIERVLADAAERVRSVTAAWLASPAVSA